MLDPLIQTRNAACTSRALGGAGRARCPSPTAVPTGHISGLTHEHSQQKLKPRLRFYLHTLVFEELMPVLL